MNSFTRTRTFPGLLFQKLSNITIPKRSDRAKIFIRSNVFANGLFFTCSFPGNNALCRSYSSEGKKHVYDFQKQTDLLQNVIEKNKEKLRDTELKIRQKGENLVKDFKHQKYITEGKIRRKKEIIIKDILETKSKVREKFEEVIEVIIKIYCY